jgi:hypothetical protein
MPHTNLHKVLNLAEVHNHIARTGYIYKKDIKHAFHLKWSDQPCWAEFLSLLTHYSKLQCAKMRPTKYFSILLRLTPDEFTRQRESLAYYNGL